MRGVDRQYGFFLALAHAVTAWLWFDMGAQSFLSPSSAVLCWPWFTKCANLKIFGETQATLLFSGYLGLSIAVGLIYLFCERQLRWAHAGLIALWIMKASIMLIDYRLRHNGHYMHFFVTALFLGSRSPGWLCRLQIVLFYFWAGTLKLSPEWLSGGALYGMPWGITKSTLVWATHYVVILELLFAWGLLSRNRWIFWGSFLQFALFHAVSWNVVGFFYPLLMFCLLSIFVMDRWAKPEPWSKGNAFALMAFFSALQMVPYAIPGDEALTGEGRLFALHMFDSRTICAVRASIQGEEIDIGHEGLEFRILCDPLVTWNRMRKVCFEHREAPVDLKMVSRRSTDSQAYEIINEKDFCRHVDGYSALSNSWIHQRKCGPPMDEESTRTLNIDPNCAAN